MIVIAEFILGGQGSLRPPLPWFDGFESTLLELMVLA